MVNESNFRFIHDMTNEHRRKHYCHAHPFSEGQNLIKTVSQLNPKKILELGTALGYTACCLASSGDDCHVDTIEGDSVHVDIARENIEKAGLASRIKVHHGDFNKVLITLSNDYDLVFFDGLAPKPSMLEKLHSMLNEGGTLICANLGFAEPGSDEFLDNEKYWEQAGKMERGGTRIVTKKFR